MVYTSLENLINEIEDRILLIRLNCARLKTDKDTYLNNYLDGAEDVINDFDKIINDYKAHPYKKARIRF